jgi:hypothetical protein
VSYLFVPDSIVRFWPIKLSLTLHPQRQNQKYIQLKFYMGWILSWSHYNMQVAGNNFVICHRWFQGFHDANVYFFYKNGLLASHTHRGQNYFMRKIQPGLFFYVI